MFSSRILRLIAVVTLVALVASQKAVSQEVQHAPSIAQFRADQRVWFAQIENGVQNDHKWAALPAFDVLSSWNDEMENCMQVDPENVVSYEETSMEVDAVQARRMLDFIFRHGLYQRFMDEDRAGKRGIHEVRSR